MNDLVTMIGEPWDDYGLVDSGGGRKLERYGRFRFIRPEPQAMWAPAQDDWRADGEFVPASDDDGGGRWFYDTDVPLDGWPLSWRDVKFQAQCTPFRHLGFFPDMAPVWDWMREYLCVDSEQQAAPTRGTGPLPLPTPQPEYPMGGREGERAGAVSGVSRTKTALNLFGYTGVGTLALSAAGASMVHVDASKKSVAQARENAALAGMADRPVRWIVDDAAKFAAREVRRERRYDAILLDPPKYGRGPDGEMWKLEDDLPGLIADCRRLVDENSACVFLTVYAVRLSALAIGELMRQQFGDLPGKVECGELGVREEARGLVLPTAIFARWSNA